MFSLCPLEVECLLAFLVAELYPVGFQGSAAFWYNLKANGDGDDSTRHAACPVLVGNKWGEIDCYILISCLHIIQHNKLGEL